MKKGGKLFLSGGGDAKDSFLLDQKFVESLKKKRVIYIPVGLERTLVEYEECLEWLTDTLSMHTKEFIDITMWVDLRGINKRDLENIDAIYIGGAKEASSLADKIYQAEFATLLKEFLKNGGLLYGGSAGAVIMGKCFSNFFDNKAKKNTRCRQGLSLVKDNSVYCHYQGGTREAELFLFAKKYNTPIISLPENSGLIIEGDKATVVGYNKVAIFGINFQRKTFSPGDSFIL